MKTFGHLYLLSAFYSVASDPAAGAIGTVNLGVTLPPNSQPWAFNVICKSSLTSAANTATLSFGTLQTGVSSPTALPTLLMAANIVTTFGVNVPEVGNGLFGNNSRYDVQGRAITMTIAVQQLTGGSFVCNIWYLKNNL